MPEDVIVSDTIHNGYLILTCNIIARIIISITIFAFDLCNPHDNES